MKYSPVQYVTVLHDILADTDASKRREAIRQFLASVGKNGSLSILPEIVREFESLSDKKAGIHHLTISSPERLSELAVSRKLSIKAKVTALRDVRLMGGATLELDDLRIDNSVAMRMERARKAFTK
ncbi:MAG: F0F1 ATP synthase subunit delta [bacterium]|nr:F0F1 ATP synthase subunit delta [bacterium]